MLVRLERHGMKGGNNWVVGAKRNCLPWYCTYRTCPPLPHNRGLYKQPWRCSFCRPSHLAVSI